jgi:methyl-accepting chemotaxis protein
MLLGFGLTLSVLLTLLGFVTYLQIRDTVVPLTHEFGVEVVKARAAEVGRLMQGYVNEVGIMAARDVMRSGDQEAIQADLVRRAKVHNPDFEMLFFADKQGHFFTSTRASGNVLDRDYWHAIMEQGQDAALSSPLISKATGDSVIVVAHVVTNERNERIGLIAATVLLNTLSDIAGSINIGERGFGWVLDPTGLVVAHPDPELRMKLNLLKPPPGFIGLDEIARKLNTGKPEMGTYTRPDGNRYLLIFSPIPRQPGWVFGISMLQSEMMDRAHRLMRNNIGLMVAMLVPALLLAWVIARSISRPIQTAVAAAERVASGDLSVSLASSGKDETGKLINALGQMVAYLNSLIGQVQRSTIDLVSTANSLSAMSKTQSEEVNNLGSTTTEIAAATKEISATSEELLNTMTGITRVADQTTELANSGQSSLGDMEGAMRSLAEATQSISGRLGLINEKANNIGSVTTTITKIADQTNLLSLNASIEAEKAGEYGLGFAVLAREIRRLADQTAVATLDIEQMVKEMQDSVTGGVMEMDKFAEQVNRSVSDTRDISQRFGEIIQQIQALLPQFDAVHEGMRSQSAGAKQIRDSMVSLTESVRVSAQALEETTAATGRLEGAIAMLRNEISVFRLD